MSFETILMSQWPYNTANWQRLRRIKLHGHL